MIRLFDLPHSEARRAVQTGAPVFLSINPVEYHGPHLSLHNDRLVSLGLTSLLHARLEADHPGRPLLVADDLEIGVDPCPGRGTRHTDFTVARRLVVEACRALAELGAKKVVLMTFHGSPLHELALEAGIEELARHGARGVAPFNVILQELLTLDPARYEKAFVDVPDAERAAVRNALSLDFHAGFFETSVALFLAPESVSDAHLALPPCPDVRPVAHFAALAALLQRAGATGLSRELEFAAVGIGWRSLRPFPGYTGRPHLATAAAGRVFAEAMIDRMAPVIEEVLERGVRSPRPIMGWLARASLDGRLGGITIPSMEEMLETTR